MVRGVHPLQGKLSQHFEICHFPDNKRVQIGNQDIEPKMDNFDYNLNDVDFIGTEQDFEENFYDVNSVGQNPDSYELVTNFIDPNVKFPELEEYIIDEINNDELLIFLRILCASG